MGSSENNIVTMMDTKKAIKAVTGTDVNLPWIRLDEDIEIENEDGLSRFVAEIHRVVEKKRRRKKEVKP